METTTEPHFVAKVLLTLLLYANLPFLAHAASSLGEACQVRYGEVGSDGDFKYFETGNGSFKCDKSNGADLTCIPEADDGGTNDIPGVCKEGRCSEPRDDLEGKVTICHRTCSENNPWVRITIDSSAWADSACKHGQHSATTCNGKDLAFWGDTTDDFILKIHGTKDQVLADFGGSTSLASSYWKHWQPGCPSVRNGACCSFDGPYGYSCCPRYGIDPQVPDPTSSPTRAPVNPTPAPVNPTPAPVNSATPAPVNPITPAPVTAATPAPANPATVCEAVVVPPKVNIAGGTTIVNLFDGVTGGQTPYKIISIEGTTLTPGTPQTIPLTGATLSITADTEVYFTQNEGFEGSGSFSYVLEDNVGGSCQAIYDYTCNKPAETCEPAAPSARRRLHGHKFEMPEPTQRHLQKTLDQKWNISEPDFSYGDQTFDLTFTIDEYISSDDQVQYVLYEDTCTTPYTGSGLNGLKGGRRINSDFIDKRDVTISVEIDPSQIGSDTQVYSEPGFLINGQQTATIDFCMRFSLYSTEVMGNDEVNFLEIIVRLNVDLTDGFDIETLSLVPKERCNLVAEDAFEVEGYFCNNGSEDIPIADLPTMNQGDVIKVCVRPVERARNLFIRLRRINQFEWFLPDNSVRQVAIENALPASNGLTDYWCTSGYAICYFETILFAAFFRTPGLVSGAGVADMVFGGEVSESSVTPRSRRILIEEKQEKDVVALRRLQVNDEDNGGAGGVAGGAATFDLAMNIRTSDEDYTSAATQKRLAASFSFITTMLLIAANTLFT